MTRCAALLSLMLADTAIVRASSAAPPAGLATWQCDADTRFTLLTDRAVRAEYGIFENRRSFAFTTARQPLPTGASVALHNDSSWCNATVSGSGMRVSYRKLPLVSHPAGALLTPFVRHALQLTAGAVHWAAGMVPSGNLGGTISTLGGAQGPVPLNCTGTSAPSVRNSRGLPTYCTLGVASRDGWAVYNDSFNAVLDDESGWATVRPLVDEWPAPYLRQEDTYIFMYGDDYLGASAALSATSGPQPMPPRHMLGPGFSRYWQFASVELRSVVRQMQQHGLPLDTLNLDTGWHKNFCFVESIELCKKLSGNFTNKELLGYSGIFEYDSDLFPSPASDLRAWLGGLGVQSYLDVHQAAGVMPQNRYYAKLARFAGVDPASLTPVAPLLMENQSFTRLYFEMLEKQVGSDVYYWIDLDGPPGAYSALAGDASNSNSSTSVLGVGIERFNVILWNQWLFYEDAERRTGRGSNLAWFSGLGSQRYPLGHSGDVEETWASLQFAPYFTATAANVNMGWWDHDVGGHRQGPDDAVSKDPELYLRWLQWSVFAPTMRSHMEKGERSVGRAPRRQFYWDFDPVFSHPMRVALQLRSRLVPLIYTLGLRTYLGEASVVRPLYYHWPKDPLVYEPAYKTQVMLGARLLVAPVVTKRDLAVNLTNHTVYIPPLQGMQQQQQQQQQQEQEQQEEQEEEVLDGGTTRCDWVSMQSLSCVAGGSLLKDMYALHETAAFVRAGTIIPMTTEPQAVKSTSDSMYGLHHASPPPKRVFNAADPAHITVTGYKDDRYPLLGGTASVPTTVVWEAYPGLSSAGEGEVREDCATTTAYKSGAVATTNASFELSDGVLSFEVAAMSGSYANAPIRRNYEFRGRGLLSPTSVELKLLDGQWHTLPPATATQHASLQSCGRLACVATGMGGWWWEARAMTVSVRVDDVDTRHESGLQIRLQLGHPGRVHDILPSGFVGEFERVLRVKTLLDWQYWTGAVPSRALNRLAETADRMQANPATAVAELGSFHADVAHALELHAGTNCSSTDTLDDIALASSLSESNKTTVPTGCPTVEFQAMMRAWLAPPLRASSAQ